MPTQVVWSTPELPTVVPDDAFESTALADDPTNVFIQWKGTNACFDFYCKCGFQSHYDGYFAYVVQCPACDQRYAMPSSMQLMEVDSVGDPVR